MWLLGLLIACTTTPEAIEPPPAEEAAVETVQEAPAKTKKGKKKRKASGEVEDAAWSVSRSDDGTVTLTLAEDFDLSGVTREARAVLHRNEAGDFDGYRLSGLKEGSLGQQMGFQNGDIVHAVNELPLTTVQQAMDAYQAAVDTDRLSFELTRGGEKTTLAVSLN